jgi:hypothetical protein
LGVHKTLGQPHATNLFKHLSQLFGVGFLLSGALGNHDRLNVKGCDPVSAATRSWKRERTVATAEFDEVVAVTVGGSYGSRIPFVSKKADQ